MVCGRHCHFQFQAWLREEWRYRRWVHLEVRDAAGTPTVQDAEPLDNVPLALPNPFRLTIALQRPEIPRALDFLDTDNQALTVVDIAQSATLFVVGGVLLALLVEFGVSPHIIARDNLALWHRVGTGMYVAQWVCAGVVFGKLSLHVHP